MRKLFCLLLILTSFQAKADVLLGAHLLINSLAVKYLPEYAATTFHGPFVAMDYGYLYERGEIFKLGDDTKGSRKPSFGFKLGYQFLRSESHKLAFVYSRKWVNFQGRSGLEGDNTMDSFGMRFNIGTLALKFGWTSHGFDELENKHDAGIYLGIGLDIYLANYSLYVDLTSHYLEERDEHIAGGDIGFRYSFGDVNQ